MGMGKAERNLLAELERSIASASTGPAVDGLIALLRLFSGSAGRLETQIGDTQYADCAAESD